MCGESCEEGAPKRLHRPPTVRGPIQIEPGARFAEPWRGPPARPARPGRALRMLVPLDNFDELRTGESPATGRQSALGVRLVLDPYREPFSRALGGAWKRAGLSRLISRRACPRAPVRPQACGGLAQRLRTRSAIGCVRRRRQARRRSTLRGCRARRYRRGFRRRDRHYKRAQPNDRGVEFVELLQCHGLVPRLRATNLVSRLAKARSRRRSIARHRRDLGRAARIVSAR